MQGFWVLSLLVFAYGVLSKAPQPNIIVILADDYGWGNIGYHSVAENAAEIQTPTLDYLNSQGIELDRHYTYRFCSPSRCAFLTGRNPIHVNAYNLNHNYNPKNNITGFPGVPLNMTMVAAKMKEAGYATHFTGKWDAGMVTQYQLPYYRGFDKSFGYLQHSNDYWRYTAGACQGLYDLWNGSGPAYTDLNPKYCSQDNQTGCLYEEDRFVEHVLAEVNAHNTSQPLFYYWALHTVHSPLEVPTNYMEKFSFINDTNRQLYAAMVNHMDGMVAQLVTLLKMKGMWDNTLILFSSDNGGPLYLSGAGNNYPLKGGKMTNWEGGVRVNAFLSGGFIPQYLQGTKSETFIAIEDWYTTFCALAGVDPTDTSAQLAGLPAVDGYNMWPVLIGQNKTSPRTEIPLGLDTVGNGDNVIVQAVISPPYKLLLGNISMAFWQGPLYPNASTKPGFNAHQITQCGSKGCLYNIIDDPTEHNEISAQYPNITSQLLSRIKYYQTTVFDADRGPQDPQACSASKAIWGDFGGPFIIL